MALEHACAPRPGGDGREGGEGGGLWVANHDNNRLTNLTVAFNTAASGAAGKGGAAGVGGAPGTAGLAATETTGGGVEVTESEIIDWCRDRIAGYKRPRSVSFIADDEMPRTATGKILHRTLRTKLTEEKG